MKRKTLDERTLEKIRLIPHWERLTNMQIARDLKITQEAVTCALYTMIKEINGR